MIYKIIIRTFSNVDDELELEKDWKVTNVISSQKSSFGWVLELLVVKEVS